MFVSDLWKRHTDLQIKAQMVCVCVCAVGGAEAAAEVLVRPGVTGGESGAVAGGSAAAGSPASSAGESLCEWSQSTATTEDLMAHWHFTEYFMKTLLRDFRILLVQIPVLKKLC